MSTLPKFSEGDKVVLNDLGKDHERLIFLFNWYSMMDGKIMTVRYSNPDRITVHESGAVWMNDWLKLYNEPHLEKELFEI